MTIDCDIGNIEFKEITPNDLGDLGKICNELCRTGKYKPDKPTPHDSPDFPDFISPYGNPAGIVVVALGEPNSNYPELQLGEHTLLGFYALNFASKPKDLIKGYGEPWKRHDKEVMHVFWDRIYIPLPFRRRGIATQLFDRIQEVLRDYGYGNMEAKPDDILKPLFERQGFTTVNGLRYGKLL